MKYIQFLKIKHKFISFCCVAVLQHCNMFDAKIQNGCLKFQIVSNFISFLCFCAYFKESSF